MSKLPCKLTETTDIDTGGIFCGINGSYMIIVWNHDKIRVPHFHIVDKKTQGQSFHCIMLIKKATYYKGETTKLPQQDILELCKHFDYSGYERSELDNWKMLINAWNRNNKKKVNTNFRRPRYEDLI